MPELPHLRIAASRVDDYASPRRGGGVEVPPRDREEQYDRVRGLIAAASAAFDSQPRLDYSSGVLFAAQGPGLEEEAGRLQDIRTKNFVLATSPDEVVVFSTQGDFSALQRKLDEYRNEQTPGGFPRHQQLIARIEDLRLPNLAHLSFGE